jgi:hypothetical protein
MSWSSRLVLVMLANSVKANLIILNIALGAQLLNILLGMHRQVYSDLEVVAWSDLAPLGSLRLLAQSSLSSSDSSSSPPILSKCINFYRQRFVLVNIIGLLFAQEFHRGDTPQRSPPSKTSSTGQQQETIATFRIVPLLFFSLQ